MGFLLYCYLAKSIKIGSDVILQAVYEPAGNMDMTSILFVQVTCGEGFHQRREDGWSQS
jgi:hypothetical protein